MGGEVVLALDSWWGSEIMKPRVVLRAEEIAQWLGAFIFFCFVLFLQRD